MWQARRMARGPSKCLDGPKDLTVYLPRAGRARGSGQGNLRGDWMEAGSHAAGERKTESVEPLITLTSRKEENHVVDTSF